MNSKISDEMRKRSSDAPRRYAKTISDLRSASAQLSTRPEAVPAYNLALYPKSLERGALLSSLDFQERRALQAVHTAYEEECARIEDEWRRANDCIRERLLEGVEERRQRADQDRDGGDVEAQSRAARKRHNKGRNPNDGATPDACAGTPAPPSNPYSLALDDLPSPFPLPLTSTRGLAPRRTRASDRESANGTEAKKLDSLLDGIAEADIRADFEEMNRGNKRRRSAGNNLAG